MLYSTVHILLKKLHTLLDILHDDVSSGKVIFSLEDIKIFCLNVSKYFSNFFELGNASEFTF